MKRDSRASSHALGKASSLSGVLVALAALLGIELAMAGAANFHRHGRVSAAPGVRTLAVAPPILEARSLLILSAAALILLLITRAYRNRAFDVSADPVPALLSPRYERRNPQSRKASIAYHTGGLYGP